MTAIRATPRVESQRRLVLDLVRDATAADTAFLYSNLGEVLDISGSPAPLAEDCRRIAHALFDFPRPPREARLYRPGPCSEGPMDRFPGGAAVVRLGGPASAWLVALGGDARHPLDRDDLHLIQIASRPLIGRLREVRSLGRLRDAMLRLVRDLAGAADACTPWMVGHGERVGRIASILGRRFGLDEPRVGDLYIAGLLHDIGTLQIEETTPGKCESWSSEDRERHFQHPILGERIVAELRPLAYLGPGIRHHHERFDGEGYPDGLAGDAIPLMARLIAVADACDALMSPRCHRKRYDAQETERILTQGAGSQWDPRVVGVFLDVREQVLPIAGAGVRERSVAAGPFDRWPGGLGPAWWDQP